VRTAAYANLTLRVAIALPSTYTLTTTDPRPSWRSSCLVKLTIVVPSALSVTVTCTRRDPWRARSVMWQTSGQLTVATPCVESAAAAWRGPNFGAGAGGTGGAGAGGVGAGAIVVAGGTETGGVSTGRYWLKLALAGEPPAPSIPANASVPPVPRRRKAAVNSIATREWLIRLIRTSGHIPDRELVWMDERPMPPS